MLYTKCPACGVQLRRESGNTAVCPKCLRGFRGTEPSMFSAAVKPQQTCTKPGKKTAGSEKKIAALLVAVMFAGITGGSAAVPLILVFSVLIIMFTIQSVITDTENMDKIPAAGEKLKTTADYLRQFRTLSLETMPLGAFGDEAVRQIQMLDAKLQAMQEMLGKEHPFENNAETASRFVLANCKQILYRLRYCDQSDPALCRVHAEYMQERLHENARVLRDFEQLLIEVMQMNNDMPVQEPCLDVLADTLRNVRTQGGTLPQMRMMQ